MRSIILISFWLLSYPIKGKSYLLLGLEDFDRRANAACKGIFNRVLIEKDGYQFGDSRETISSVLGKNKVDGTLTNVGKCLSQFLDFIENDHCIKSIDVFDETVNYHPGSVVFMWLYKTR